ncbi:MAG: AEC family transporter [bacterium]|nr:AEC family transporter [bacterium]
MNIVLDSLLPIFGLMLLGALSKKTNILGKNSDKVISRFVLYFALPAILFIAVAEAPIEKLLNIKFIVISSIILGTFYIIIFIASYLAEKSAPISSLRSLALSFPNTAFMGIPILLSLFGEKSLLPLAMINLLTTLLFCCTILVLELTEKNQPKSQKVHKKLLKIMIKQPIMLSIIAGIIISALKIHLPIVLSGFCHQLGSTAGPCAMFILGEKLLDIKFNSFFNKAITVGCILKLIIMPAVTLVMMLIFHVNPFWAACGFLLLSLPCASSTYMIAVDKKLYIKESSELIIVSTIVSFISLSAIIILIQNIWPTVHFII